MTTRIANVYVHAPFCARRCCYCDFAVHVDRSPDGGRWLAVIRREFEAVRDSGEAPLAETLDTLYVGGGTPSLLDARYVAELGDLIGRGRMRSPGFEWTVEANPESFTRDVAREWKAGGTNRISFGVQSFDARALRWMGRLHSPEQAGSAVRLARAVGIANVSVDLIFGLPDGVSRSWRDDVERALDLGVPHISLYGLTVEKGTSLCRLVSQGRARMPADDRYREEYLFAAETLAGAGYDHYEVSNFALPGFASRHNRACWTGASYLGLGNGAHSYHSGRRWWNERDWGTYAERVERSGNARDGTEALTPEQSRLERIWLALRTAGGLDALDLGPGAAPVVRDWMSRGLARHTGTRIRLTPAGWLLLDDLTLELEAVLNRR
ncbi:MAG: radical SAM family heme chaperone HemW [Gemmatimonadota bacterium]|nr:radical SAM family heme chaperone HemW [Gemmatimonadota bacterium]